MSLKALALNGTLKSSDSSEPSSTGKLLELITEEFKMHGVETDVVRLADHDIKPGVTSDEGEGDAWPEIRKKVLEADTMLVGTPIWLGQPGSVCKRALERMDAFLEETDDQGRMVSYSKVAAVAVVGNEDGAHHVSAEIFQALNDVGFTIPANAVAYWVGEAMGSTNFVDLKKTPEAVQTMIPMLARNTTHLAKLLKKSQYPGEEGKRAMATATATRNVHKPPVFAEPHPQERSLTALRRQVEACERCDLYKDATQTVFGEGPSKGKVILVGEQPGDHEDIAGRPFVGPAGRLLDECLQEASVDRSLCYVTNAVKHFKFEPRDKRRLHAKPNAGEIQSCAWWLGGELDLIRPDLIVALGAAALYALMGRSVGLTQERGHVLQAANGLPILVTIHPSYLLRIRDHADRESERRRFFGDLKNIHDHLDAQMMSRRRNA